MTISDSLELLFENSENSLNANNVISIEDNNAESYSSKSTELNNISISTDKNISFRYNRKKQEQKKDQIITATVDDSMVKDIIYIHRYIYIYIHRYR